MWHFLNDDSEERDLRDAIGDKVAVANHEDRDTTETKHILPTQHYEQPWDPEQEIPLIVLA